MQNFHVVGCIHSKIAQRVKDILLDPPAQNKYDKLKAEIIRRTSFSEQKRLQLLLASEQLGDRKPSQMLSEMRLLLGTTLIEQAMLKELFLQRVPEKVIIGLASAIENSTLDQLAEIADRLHERCTTFTTINATASAESLSHNDSDIITAIASLSKSFEKLSADVPDRQRPFQRDSRRELSTPATFGSNTNLRRVTSPHFHRLTLNLGLRRQFQWIFLIADVSQAILGANFLQHFGLAVDLRAKKLLDTTTHISVVGTTSSSTSLGLAVEIPENDPNIKSPG